MAFLVQTLLYAVVTLGAAVWVWRLSRLRGRNPLRLPYPPGPKPLPFVGNMLDLPTKMPWKTYAQWGKQFGDIIHVNVFGQHIIIINSAELAHDLFEKRAHIYSDKPVIPMLHLTGWDFVFGFMPYNDYWRKHRRIFHQVFRREQLVQYNTVLTRKAHEMLQRLLHSPERYAEHVYHWSTDSIMTTVYGYELAPQEDRFLQIAEHANGILARCVLPGSFAVNSLPILQRMPDWFPGTGYRKVATTCQKFTAEMQNMPYEATKKRMETSPQLTSSRAPNQATSQDEQSHPSVTSNLIRRAMSRGQLNEVEEGFIKRVAGVAYAAGSETTGSSYLSGILALTMFPEAQQKAQAEIDSVVGKERLPDFRDRNSLPYAEALLREVLRWGPVTPVALAHCASNDDIYDGYFIPKGAMVFGNAWAILHDEHKYENPEQFMPERWLTENGRLVDDFPLQAFGFGRRICAGKYIASQNLWLALVSVLSMFDVKRRKDADGNDVPVTGEFTDGWICRPMPFECDISPRSPLASVLLRESSTPVFKHDVE